MTASPHDITQLLNEWGHGDRVALERLMPLVYTELRKMARRHMQQQRPGHTLQTTALIHEAYLRLVCDSDKRWESRTHFFGVAAKAMRCVLVDYARARRSAKRGGGAVPVTLNDGICNSSERMAGLIALDDALNDLAELNPRHCQVVELRFFGGFSVEETAAVLKVSPETVMRDWRAAKAHLERELNRSHDA